ncbi:MAG: hypothetical protein ACFWT6_09515 [Virgibacillus proomii]|jgi:hypothetical protein
MVSFPLHPFAHLEWDQEQRYSDKILPLMKWKGMVKFQKGQKGKENQCNFNKKPD